MTENVLLHTNPCIPKQGAKDKKDEVQIKLSAVNLLTTSFHQGLYGGTVVRAVASPRDGHQSKYQFGQGGPF